MSVTAFVVYLVYVTSPAVHGGSIPNDKAPECVAWIRVRPVEDSPALEMMCDSCENFTGVAKGQGCKAEYVEQYLPSDEFYLVVQGESSGPVWWPPVNLPDFVPDVRFNPTSNVNQGSFMFSDQPWAWNGNNFQSNCRAHLTAVIKKKDVSCDEDDLIATIDNIVVDLRDGNSTVTGSVRFRKDKRNEQADDGNGMCVDVWLRVKLEVHVFPYDSSLIARNPDQRNTLAIAEAVAGAFTRMWNPDTSYTHSLYPVWRLTKIYSVQLDPTNSTIYILDIEMSETTHFAYVYLKYAGILDCSRQCPLKEDGKKTKRCLIDLHVDPHKKWPHAYRLSPRCNLLGE